MKVALAPTLPEHLSHAKTQNSTLAVRVHRAAISFLTQWVAAMAIMAVCLPFMPPGTSILLVAGISTAHVGVDSIIQFIAHCSFTKQSWGRFLTDYACSIHFASSIGKNALVLIHEFGHASIAKILFGGSPKIALLPFKGGHTTFFTKCLTKLGTGVGFRRSIFLTFLAGPAITVFAGMVLMLASAALKRQNHEISSHRIRVLGASAFRRTFIYAVSALWTSPANRTHDFVRLRSLGLHPLIAAGTIGGLFVYTMLKIRAPSLQIAAPKESQC